MSFMVSDSFYNEEIRNGYTITKKQKKIWAIELDLVSKLLNVCERHGIKIIAMSGTLLGCVRHRGFIPWDDDLDVALPRKDFEKLIKVASEEFSYPYFFQTAETDRRYFCGYARLRNSETTGIISYTPSVNYNNGIYIDIYVLDGYADNKVSDFLYTVKRNILEKVMRLFTYERGDNNNGRILSSIKIFLKSVVLKYFRYEDILKKYKIHMNKYCNSERIGLQTHKKKERSKYWVRRSDFDSIEYLDFEMIKLPVPKNYDEILTHIYGNYMELPSIQERGKWHENMIYFDPDISYKEYLKKVYRS